MKCVFLMDSFSVSEIAGRTGRNEIKNEEMKGCSLKSIHLAGLYGDRPVTIS